MLKSVRRVREQLCVPPFLFHVGISMGLRGTLLDALTLPAFPYHALPFKEGNKNDAFGNEIDQAKVYEISK